MYLSVLMPFQSFHKISIPLTNLPKFLLPLSYYHTESLGLGMTSNLIKSNL